MLLDLKVFLFFGVGRSLTENIPHNYSLMFLEKSDTTIGKTRIDGNSHDDHLGQNSLSKQNKNDQLFT